MDTVYRVENAYDTDLGYSKTFREKKNAKQYRDALKAKAHQQHCVEQKVNVTNCLCVTSNGTRECAAHHEIRHMVPHTPNQCHASDDWIYIEKVEIE